MPSKPPRRSFDRLDSAEQERIRANIRKLEAEGVEEAEVERYLRERENLLRPGDKETLGEKFEGWRQRRAEKKDAERVAKLSKHAIPATGKTEEGAHILPRMTITQPSSPRAANKAHHPVLDESIREALPAAAKASKAALREAAPDKLVQGMARGTVRIPTDLIALGAKVAGKKDLNVKARQASEALAEIFGNAETPIGDIAEFLPLEAAGLAALPTIVPKSPKIPIPRAPKRTLDAIGMTKAEAEAAAVLEELGRETARKSSGRALPAAAEPKLLPRAPKEPLLLPERSSGRLHGPAIPAPGHVPAGPEALEDIVRGAEQERKIERSTRLFGGEPPLPASVPELIVEAASKPRSVDDLAKTLSESKVPPHRRFTGQYLKGEAERLHGPRPRTGAVDPELLIRAIVPAAATLTGAATNDDPVEGALLGFGAGMAGGVAGGRLVKGLSGSKLARTPEMQAVIERIGFGDADLQRMGRWGDRVMYALDRWSPLEKVGERMEKLGLPPSMNPLHKKNLAMSSGVRVHQALRGEGLRDPDTLQTLGPSLERVFEPIGQNVADVQTAEGYLKAMRDVGRIERMGLKAVGDDVALAEKSRKFVEQASPELQEFGKRWKAYTTGLGEYAVRRGLWTPEQWHLIEESDALYVPYRRAIETMKKGDYAKAPKSGMKVTSGVQRFRGGQADVTDLVDTVADYTDALIKRADRYALGQSLRDAVMQMSQNGDAAEWFEVLTPAFGVELNKVKLTENRVLDMLAQQGIEGEAAELLTDLYTPALSKDNPMLVLNKPGGGKEYWRVNNPEMVEMMSHLTPDRSAATRVLIDALKVAKHVATVTKTGLQPGFAGTNMGRDIWDAWGKTRDGVTFAEIGKAWYQVLSGTGAFAPLAGAAAGAAVGAEAESPGATTIGAIVGGAMGMKLRGKMQGKVEKALLAEMETMGAIGNVSIVAKEVAPRTSVARFAPSTRWRRFKSVVADIAGKPVEALATVTATSDTFARTAAWKAAIRSKQHLVKSGKWTERDLRYYAASQARGATVDFGRTPGWELLAAAGEIVPFLNAAIQGSVRYGRAWKHSPERMAMMSSGVALTAALAWAINDRGENPLLINDRPATERAAFIHFPLPGVDTKLSIPLTQENGVIAAGVGYALSHLSENDPDAASRLRESLMRLLPDAYLPVGKEIFEIARNKTSFGSRPIETERMEQLLPEDRKLPTTRPMYTGAARMARGMGMESVSPQQAEHFVRGQVGSFADIAGDVLLDEVAIAAGEDPATAARAPRPASSHPMNPLRSILREGVPTRSASEDAFFRTLEVMEQAGNSLRQLGKQAAGRADSASTVNAFLNDPKRGGRLPRSANGVVDLGFARDVRDQLLEARKAEQGLLEQWRRGEMDEQTYRAETARYRAARQQGYRAILRQLHDAGVTIEGTGNWPQR